MGERESVEVTFEPGGRVVRVARGSTIAEAADASGLMIGLPCGGKGRCQRCAAEAKGRLSALSVAEKAASRRGLLAAGRRLMCQAKLLGDATVRVPETVTGASARIMEEGRRWGAFSPDPNVRRVVVEVARPSFEDQAGDKERVCAALSASGINPSFDLPVLSGLGPALRDSGFRCAVTLLSDEVVDVRPEGADPVLGMAFDIGTTTVVGYLMDLSTGRELAVASGLNPQGRHGADVISRIMFCVEEKEGLAVMTGLIRDLLNGLTDEACREAHVSPLSVYEVCVAGNATMTHLFLGVDPHYLALSPYVPVTTGAFSTKARALGLKVHPGAGVYVLPGIGGFIGADTTGVIVATSFCEGQGPALAIDIGTNGEIVGRDGAGELFALSTAAGPAFEGAKISCGLRGMEGAIEAVGLSGPRLTVRTIGDGKPAGICGSGLVDALSVMRRAGVLTEAGRLLDGDGEGRRMPRRVVRGASGLEFVLVKGGRGKASVSVTQKDIRELQLAKGAIAAGIKIMLDRMGVTEGELAEVLLAGAFGNYIDKANARSIGLLPNVPLDSIEPVGNAAGEGAKLALLSGKVRAQAEETVRRVRVINLAHTPGFSKRFIESMSLKEA